MNVEKIFISYSKKDRIFTTKLTEDLRERNFKVWYDPEIGGGDEWRSTIEDKVKEAEDVIVVLSPNAIDSDWVQHEGSMAYALGKRIFPILIDHLEEDQILPPWMDRFQYIDFVSTEYENALSQLVKSLTPPNPIQDLLDMQVAAYHQTGDLMSKAVFGVIEEAYASLNINSEAEELIDTSRKAIVRQQRTTRLGWLGIAVVIGIALVIATLGVTGQLNRYIYRPLLMEWVEIPAGDFVMGSPAEDGLARGDEFPQHHVYLDAYGIGRYEVTNQQYAQCVRAGVCSGSSRIDPERTDHPVVQVTWYDAQLLCEWQLTDGRLPTEAEWEKAARGGLDGAYYPWGDEEPTCDPDTNNGAQYEDCGGETVSVGSFTANGYGLYDMAGNACEWVADYYSETYYANSPENNPAGPETGDLRVVRGGSWLHDVYILRVANRVKINPKGKFTDCGFRCARSP